MTVRTFERNMSELTSEDYVETAEGLEHEEEQNNDLILIQKMDSKTNFQVGENVDFQCLRASFATI